MTLIEAVAILNDRRHRGYREWQAWSGYALGPDRDAIEEFEAVAVAEKYAREVAPSPAGN